MGKIWLKIYPIPVKMPAKPYLKLKTESLLEPTLIFVGSLIPLFWNSGYISWFQGQSGQPYSHLVEVYVLHVL